MLHFVRLVAVGLCMFLGACAPQANHAPVSGKRETAILESWEVFQRALEKPDIEAVASMTRFPLENNIGHSEDFKGFGRRSTFGRDFHQMFWDGAGPLLMSYKPTPAELRAGEWSVNYSEKTLDTESCVIFGFKCAPDGKVWLTSVIFAG